MCCDSFVKNRPCVRFTCWKKYIQVLSSSSAVLIVSGTPNTYIWWQIFHFVVEVAQQTNETRATTDHDEKYVHSRNKKITHVTWLQNIVHKTNITVWNNDFPATYYQVPSNPAHRFQQIVHTWNTLHAKNILILYLLTISRDEHPVPRRKYSSHSRSLRFIFLLRE